MAIIGGGAAGLAAAIFAAEVAQGSRIIVLDGAKSLGAKILVSGGGRCNVTHHMISSRDFNGSQNIVRNILAAFDVDQTVKWFESLGVQLKREPTGKLFPVADSAKVVLNALLRRCDELRVELRTGSRVKRIVASHQSDRPFVIQGETGELRAARAIVCTGGRSLPKTGSDGSGWAILRELGHTVTPAYAALVPLVLDPKMFHAQLAGIAQEVELSVIVNGKRVDHRAGSLLWTHFGISGPVVMDASRHWTIASETNQQPILQCNFLPGENVEQVEQWFVQTAKERPKVFLLNCLSTRLPERVAAALLNHLMIDPTTMAGQLSRDARRSLVRGLTALILPVTGHRGWNYAEVTAGGVPLNEIDYRTMQSRKVAGLFLAGEVLDCDGRIGGFNFQWAWATGHLAGRAAGT
ncbi:MAG TPA: NAD(P)/FAD-dependent oxidoreductase [Tepidisphaeraceae bacterium]|nr:NAD(P)/FAD-dependent oxidoreductase [Tepidisphaeraceae bacterium]